MKLIIGEICPETLEQRLWETTHPLSSCLSWVHNALGRVVFIIAEPGESAVEVVDEAHRSGFRVLEQNDLPSGESWIALAPR